MAYPASEAYQRRNNVVFREASGQQVTPKLCIEAAKEYAAAMDKTKKVKTGKTGGGRKTKWERPTDDWVKINTDGAVSRSACAAAGGVVRGQNADWIAGFAINIGSCSVLMAEGRALLGGLELAWKLGFKKVLLESDFEVLISLMKGRLRSSHPMFSLVESCHGFLRRDWSVQFRHVYREANVVDDGLAALALNFPLGFHSLSLPPTCVAPFLILDADGSSSQSIYHV